MVMEELQVHHFTSEEIKSQKIAMPVIESGSYEVREDDSPFGYCSNFPCPICRSNIALFNNTAGTMNPCTDCRLRGYHTFRLKKTLNLYDGL